MKVSAIFRTMLIGAALSAGSLFANSVTLSSTGFNGGLLGGEFTAVTSHDGTFVTFCIEKNVSVSLGANYNYSISPVAQLQGDPVSAGTAWLYEKFFLGTLVSADGSGMYNQFGEQNFNAGELQKAFWDLEGEGADAGNLYVAMVVSNLGSYAAAIANAAPGSKVQAMNIWTASGGDIQSQLIYVPDSGLTVALLGLGLLTLAAFRRKL